MMEGVIKEEMWVLESCNNIGESDKIGRFILIYNTYGLMIV